MSSGPLPEYVDAFQVFVHGARISASVPLEKLARFRQYLDPGLAHSDQPLFQVTLEFARDASGNRQISGSLAGHAVMQCQRCLGPVELEIDSEIKLLVADNEQNARELDGEDDTVLSVLREDHRVVELLPMIEDELILALPTVALHAGSDCEMQAYQRQADSAPLAETGEPAGNNTDWQDQLLALRAQLKTADTDPE